VDKTAKATGEDSGGAAKEKRYLFNLVNRTPERVEFVNFLTTLLDRVFTSEVAKKQGGWLTTIQILNMLRELGDPYLFKRKNPRSTLYDQLVRLVGQGVLKRATVYDEREAVWRVINRYALFTKEDRERILGPAAGKPGAGIGAGVKPQASSAGAWRRRGSRSASAERSPAIRSAHQRQTKETRQPLQTRHQRPDGRRPQVGRLIHIAATRPLPPNTLYRGGGIQPASSHPNDFMEYHATRFSKNPRSTLHN